MMTLTLRSLRYRPVLAVLLLPSLALIGVFSYYPAVRSLIGGFYQWNGFSPPTYAGVSQFKEYLQSPTFGTEAKNLAILVGGSILITLVSQFTAAEIVTHLPQRAAAIAKYLLVLPIVLPPLVLIEVWAYLLQPGSGLIDKVFGAVGLPQPVWLSDPHLALLSILLIGFPWISNLGFLIFLGGLQNLPRDVLDAGRLDGLGGLRRVFAIDIPDRGGPVRHLRGAELHPDSAAHQRRTRHGHARSRPGHVPVRVLQRPVRLRHGHRHPALRRDARLHTGRDAATAVPDRLITVDPPAHRR
jgi:ABC-type sugar transport system permease subunit